MEQFFSGGVLLVVLLFIASGRYRIEIPALIGLLLLGIVGIAPLDILFSGFGHPALATIIAVFLVSEGIIESGLLRGLGQALAHRLHSPKGQVMSLAATSSLLSAFMNNVGAVGLMLPTAVRMATRARLKPGSFGLPLAISSILGGALTVIGSAPNIIIASYRFSFTGQSFKMFDFAPHGLAMLVTAWLLWLLCKRCGFMEQTSTSPIVADDTGEIAPKPPVLDEVIHLAPLATRQRQITLVVVLLAILVVSFGLLHPALGFGGAALILFITGVLKPLDAYKSIDMGVVFFLGAMLGIGQTLSHTGALANLSDFITHFTSGFSPFWLVVLLVFVSSILSNAINNSAAAVFMAPLAMGIAAGSNLPAAAALMAVAAGSNMTLLLPTHQATLMVLSKAPFSPLSFLRYGVVLSVFCGLAASIVITLVWG